MCDTPVILNLHDIKRDSYIRKIMSGHHYAVEGRGLCAETHLAWLGVKIQETAFRVHEQKMKGSFSCLFYAGKGRRWELG